MSEIEIKACPFCGGKGHISRDHCPDDTGIFYSIKCGSCGAKSGEKYASHGNDCGLLFQEVRDLWNNRPLENNKDTRIANLEAENKRLREVLEKNSAALNLLATDYDKEHKIKFSDDWAEYGTLSISQILDEADGALSKGGQ
ncbi:Lar family restriction alleviation protein [Cohaesibacter gelatinilyticus]|uniref:Restriction alleviation protein Lar n=1 Tax=Cohaesibacter gelatinilyticus TaxID=372072 RepID=A0A285PIX9_9HYPH|nr:Lar family restriction alleviation protein [Cohaesibacter gelatinilyticus]SNZ21679.1 Restriction alleviation protein Lar [Cohaesibacter gelatinilyticus]